MTNQLGEQLTELEEGDSVAVVVGDDRYEGAVSNIARRKCELVRGFMEEGYIGVYLKIDAETAQECNLPTSHLVVGATENVPWDWDRPTVSTYDPVEDETAGRIGEVTNIETG